MRPYRTPDSGIPRRTGRATARPGAAYEACDGVTDKGMDARRVATTIVSLLAPDWVIKIDLQEIS